MPRSFGVGLDLPWGPSIGFVRDEAGRDRVGDRVPRFFARHEDSFGYAFVSFQPRDRGLLDAREYFDVYDDLFARTPTGWRRALHHTMLNTAARELRDTRRLIDFTNTLIERYDFAWVNEDLGLWSLDGKRLPYPLPPLLTDDGLRVCVANVGLYQRELAAPLLVEFPGFSDGASFFIGHWHAYDFFRRVVEDTGSPCTLDVAHLLGYQWLRGRRGDALYEELERLPLDSCFEIHLSGAEIVGDRFIDAHHGVLMNEQFALLDRLLALCPNARAVTFEDPKFRADGALIDKAVAPFNELKSRVATWAG